MEVIGLRYVGMFALAALMSVGVGAEGVGAQGAAGEPVQGVWQSAGTKIRITANRSEARATFAEVGPQARELGFKPGEISFVATVNGHYLHGEQTTRYGGRCHPNGRKTPMMGRATPDRRALAIHYYNVVVDPTTCQDTGRYTVIETIWQRVER